MRQWTRKEILDKVNYDLDLTNERFVDPTEMLGYLDEAIHTAESEILGIYEDYFLTSASLTLVAGTSQYDLPSDLYAHKIRHVIYSNAGTVYSIRRLKGLHLFERISLVQPGDLYTYFIRNDSGATGPKIHLLPAAVETGSGIITVWYLRSAARLGSSTATDSTLCDIPEFALFVIEFIKMRVRSKEAQGQIPPDAAAAVEASRAQMVDTLSAMVPDDDTTIEADLTHYWEMN